MSLLLKKEPYQYFEVTSFENTECSVDTEYYLPDYCPDIQKILKCIADIQIVSYTLSESRLMVQGNLNIIVMYTDEKGDSIRNCELTKEFTVNAKVNCPSEQIVTYFKAFCGHIICRAVSARKLDIHIPIVMNYAFCIKNGNEIVSDAVNCEKRENQINTSNAYRLYSKDASISHNIELSSAMKPIESIIRKEIEFLNVKAIPSDDAVDISAVAEVTVIYRSYSENSDIEKMKYQIPISERIELTGCSSDMLTFCSIFKGELSLQPKEDGKGENTVIALYAKFGINLLLYINTNVKYITDAYSVKYKSNEKYIKQLLKTYSEKDVNIEQGAELNTENLQKVIDVWCDDTDVLSFCEPTKINHRGKLTLNILYFNSDKKVCFVNKTIDFNGQLNFDDEKQRKTISFAAVKAMDYKIAADNSIKVKITLSVHSFIETHEYIKVISESETGEEIVTDSGKINIIYSGSDLWSIAKKHRVSVNEIMEINSIENEENFNFPLLIYK